MVGWGDIFSDSTIAAAMLDTGYSTEASCSPSPVTATGYAPTRPKLTNNDRKETETRLTSTPHYE